jgi:transposase InsO family protein
LSALSQAEKIEYLLALRSQGEKVIAICQQYGVAESTFYYWLSRYETHGTFDNLSRAPHLTHQQVTQQLKDAVIKKHKENPRLGCWRLSLFSYDGVHFSSVTIWHILNEVKPSKLPSQPLYTLTHFHQIWFIDHMHIITLPSGQKVYSLLVVDGMSRVLLSDEVIFSKSARDAALVLVKAFTRWGLPDEIVSDNAKAFESLLFTLLLSSLEVRVGHTTPGRPWENPYAESLIGTLRDYLYPFIQRQRTVAGVRRVYREKVDHYNTRVHWEFRNDAVKTPLEKLSTVGRPMPENFSLDIVEMTQHVERTVSGHGWISIRRYQLYVSVQLAKQKVDIHEFVTNWVVTYHGSAVVTYRYCQSTDETSPKGINSFPLFHDHGGIPLSPQLELFDLAGFSSRRCYMKKRPPNRKRKRFPIDAIQLAFDPLP